MAESNIGKFSSVHKLLSQHSFKVDKNIPDKLKCAKCKKLLIDPYQGPCLCIFCRKCIDTMIKSGIDKCPGNKFECKDEQLSTFLSHYETNSKISKLVQKCPEQMCSHKCELMKMEEHLNMCSKKIDECPFYSLGCTEDKLFKDKMSDHFQLEGYKHNKILMEYLRKELSVLKQCDEKNKEEIQLNKDQIKVLMENSRIKDRTIEMMGEEIRRNNLHIAALKENSPVQIETITMMLEEIQNNKNQIKEILIDSSIIKNEKIAEMTEEIEKSKDPTELLSENARLKDETIAKMHTEIRSIKMKSQELSTEINNLKTESENKINNLRLEIKMECPSKLVAEMNKMTKQIVALENWLGILEQASFTWKVDQISDKRENGTDSVSPIFYPRNNPYKMQLRMFSGAGKDEFEIWFRIHCSDKDAHLKWPMQGNVTMKIVNQTNPSASETITKCCNVIKPNNYSYSRSDKFKFSYVELSAAGLITRNCFTVEHSIE